MLCTSKGMIIPVGPVGGSQHLVRIDTDTVTGEATRVNLFGVRYVPLVRPAEGVDL